MVLLVLNLKLILCLNMHPPYFFHTQLIFASKSSVVKFVGKRREIILDKSKVIKHARPATELQN